MLTITSHTRLSKLKKMWKRGKKSLKIKVVGPPEQDRELAQSKNPEEEKKQSQESKELDTENQGNHKQSKRSKRDETSSKDKPDETKVPSKSVQIRFHAFVCPDIKVNKETFEFGIICEENEWNGENKKKKPLQLIKYNSYDSEIKREKRPNV